MAAEITPFTFPETGQPVRTVTIDGEPWWVAADVCAVLGHTNTTVALSMVDADERRDFRRSEALNFTEVIPDRRVQSVNLVNESGLYSLILRSNVSGARAFKRWITHEVIPAIRRTGRYELAPAPAFEIPASFAEALELAARQARELEAATAKVAELEPAADAWTALANAAGDYSVADAAKILHRGGIPTGRDRLFATLHGLDWTYRQGADGRYRAKQYAVDRGWLAELPKSHTHPVTGEAVLDAPQIRVTVKGLHELRLRLLPPMDIPPLFPAA